MAGGDKDEDSTRWVRLLNKGHGYAGIFNCDNSDDKRIVEKSIIEEWRAAIKAEFGIEIDALQPNPNDPPDFFVTIRGQLFTVELVQLVDKKTKVELKKMKRRSRDSYS